MGFLQEIMKNQVLVSSVTGWVVAQFLKTLVDVALNKSFTPERLVGSGRNAEFPFRHGLCTGSFFQDFVMDCLPLSLQSVLFWQPLSCMMPLVYARRQASSQNF